METKGDLETASSASASLMSEGPTAATAPVPFKQRLLRPGIEWGCFCAFLGCCTMSIAGLVFINAAQTYVIIDILEYPRAELGRASGSLAFADELLCVPLVSLWGVLSDRLGRRPVMSCGLLFMGLAIGLYPWAATVFPATLSGFFTSMLFFRLIFALGGSASTAMITALIGDYATDTSRAKVAGFTGTAAGLGALLAVRVFTRLPIMFTEGCLKWLHVKRADIVLTFSTTAVCMGLAALAAAAFMASPQLQPRTAMPWKARLRTGILATRQPLVALAYLSGFVARADSIALSLFVGPWVDNYMTKTGRCPPGHQIGLVRCEPAKRLTSNLMSASHSATLLGAPFAGILADRMGPVAAVAVPALLGVLSFGMLFLASTPTSPMVYGAMFACGLADIGMIISSMALISSQSSPAQRGALAGVYSLFGAVGIIVTSKLGGLLFDHYRETAPFSIVTVASGGLFAAVLAALLLKMHRV